MITSPFYIVVFNYWGHELGKLKRLIALTSDNNKRITLYFDKIAKPDSAQASEMIRTIFWWIRVQNPLSVFNKRKAFEDFDKH